MSLFCDRRLSRLALIGVAVAALTLAGCGRKGPLDPPPGASMASEPVASAPANASATSDLVICTPVKSPMAPPTGLSRRPARTNVSSSIISSTSEHSDAPLCLSQRRAARRGGQSRHARGTGRHAVLLKLFDGNARTALQRVCQRLRRCERAGLLRHEGELEPGRHQDARQARRWCRCCVGWRVEARSRRRHCRQQDHVLRFGQDRGGDGAGGRRRAFSASTSNPNQNLELLSQIASSKGKSAHVSVRALIPMSTPRRITRSPPARPKNKFGIPISSRARGLCQCVPSCRDWKGRRCKTCTSAARSRTSIRSAMPSRCWPSSCARCAPTATTISHVDLGGGLGIPPAYRDDNEPPPLPDAYADVVKRATRNLDCRLIFEPGPPHRWQRRYSGDARFVREARRSQELCRRRCGDERPDPADTV